MVRGKAASCDVTMGSLAFVMLSRLYLVAVVVSSPANKVSAFNKKLEGSLKQAASRGLQVLLLMHIHLRFEMHYVLLEGNNVAH